MQRTVNAPVVGSIPTFGAKALLLQLVERTVLEAVESQFESERGHHCHSYGLKVFMDAYMPVTHGEGDRYPLGPPKPD